MKLIPQQRVRYLLTASLGLALLSGCGGGEVTGTVSGTVTLGGEPVTAGQICLISASGFSAIADIGSDGSFTVAENVPVGKYTVTVNPPAITEAPGEEGDSAEMVQSDIPEGYFDEGTSDVTKEVVKGENKLTIDLKAEGPAAGPAAEVAP